MFFTNFNPMSKEEIDKKVAAKPKADGPACDCLVGWSFKARLEGEFAPEQLEYKILDNYNLTVIENGQANANIPLSLWGASCC